MEKRRARGCPLPPPQAPYPGYGIIPCVSTSALIPPPAQLTGCVRAFYWHDLPQAPDLPLPQRMSRIPPNPYMAMVWLLSGEALLVEAQGQPCERPLPRTFLAGPTRHGWRSLAITPYRSFGLVLQPGAFALLAGDELARAAGDPTQDVRPLLDSGWQGLIEQVTHAPDHATRQALCEGFLGARWQASRPALSPWARLSEQAWRYPAQAAALRLLNWTTRHFQRRTRAMTGMSPGEVARMIRLEQALRDLRDGGANGAQVAAAHGFADQAHFSREVRRAYGRSPGQLLREVAQPAREEDWLLRL